MKSALIAAVLVILAVSSASAQDAKLAGRAAMSRLKGADNAPLTVLEIADFQCPFCSRFARDVYPRIDSAYVKTGKAKWIFVNFPLPMHANSWAASEAAMCAGGVSGQFWPMHDKLFGNQSDWSALANPAPLFAKYAKDIGVAGPAFQDCVANDKIATLIVRDLLNVSSQVTGTPAFKINDDPIFAGYKPFEEWKEILDNALKKAGNGK